MQKRTPTTARIVAVLAIVAAAVALIAVVSGSDVGGDSKGGSAKSKKHDRPHRTKASAYVVESGDTLTAIAHKTGVPVAEIIALNPNIDPQILIAGEKLKLK